MPTVANSRPMLEEQAASLTTDEDFLLEQQQTLSRECAESVLTSNDLTENYLMSEEELEELLPLDLTSAQYVFFGPAVKSYTTLYNLNLNFTYRLLIFFVLEHSRYISSK